MSKSYRVTNHLLLIQFNLQFWSCTRLPTMEKGFRDTSKVYFEHIEIISMKWYICSKGKACTEVILLPNLYILQSEARNNPVFIYIFVACLVSEWWVVPWKRRRVCIVGERDFKFRIWGLTIHPIQCCANPVDPLEKYACAAWGKSFPKATQIPKLAAGSAQVLAGRPMGEELDVSQEPMRLENEWVGSSPIALPHLLASNWKSGLLLSSQLHSLPLKLRALWNTIKTLNCAAT